MRNTNRSKVTFVAIAGYGPGMFSSRSMVDKTHRLFERIRTASFEIERDIMSHQ